MLHTTVLAIQYQGRFAAPQARRQGAALPRRLVVAASGKKQTVWNGEGPDYTMKDVERLAEQEAARRFHLPADEGQWDGEGKDYDMKDVERFHEGAATGATQAQTVWNGEGPDYSMTDVERFHDEVAAKARRAPDESQTNGEGIDYGMVDVQRFHNEAAKDKMARRK